MHGKTGRIHIYETVITTHFLNGRQELVSNRTEAASTNVSYKKVVKQLKESEKKALMARKALLAKKALMAKKANARVVKKVVRQRRRVKQTFDRFVVLATSLGNVNKDTTGWTASLTTGAVTVTTDFDDFGVARFPTITTLTTVSYTLRIRDEAGNLLTTKSVSANREFFVARF